jgi:HPt (histidine-containing phosphotransfer) domain-containing protein
MGDSSLEQAMESLAEGVVLLMPDDRMSLEGLRSRFQRLVALLPDDEETITEQAAHAIAAIDRALMDSPEPDLLQRLNQTVEGIQAYLHRSDAVGAEVIDHARQEFVDHRAGIGQLLDRLLRTAIRQRDDLSLAAFRRELHSLKGEAGVLGFDDLHHLCHRMETALAQRPMPLAWLGDGCVWIGRYRDFLAGGDPPGSVPKL